MPIFVGNSTVNTAIANSTITVDQTKNFAYATSNRNSIRPSLVLDFARSQTVDPRITFARASSATYFNSLGVLTTATNNVPRIDYNPSTLVCNGLLIEQASTNLITYSGDVSTFGTTFSTLTANSATSPDGTTTAALMIPSVDLNNNHYINKVWNGSVGNSVTFTISIFAKTAGYQWIRMNPGNAMGGGYCFFDIINGVIGTYGTVTNPAIQACGNGWFRCSYQFTTAATGTGGIGHQVYAANSNSGFANWSGNGTSGYYFWGAQVEQLAFPTSYIATTSASATRVVDYPQISVSSFINPSSGAFYIECYTNNPPTSGTQGGAFLAQDSSFTSVAVMIYSSLGGFTNYINVGGTTQLNAGVASLIGQNIKSGMSYSLLGNSMGAINGTLSSGVATNVSLPVTTLYLGCSAQQPTYPGIWNLNGWIRKFAYYPAALSNTELQTLTS